MKPSKPFGEHSMIRTMTRLDTLGIISASRFMPKASSTKPSKPFGEHSMIQTMTREQDSGQILERRMLPLEKFQKPITHSRQPYRPGIQKVATTPALAS